jgi:hypothetical protein
MDYMLQVMLAQAAGGGGGIGGGCPAWSGTNLTIDTTPLTKWNRVWPVYATNETFSLSSGSQLQIAFCLTRAVGTEMALAISPDGNACYLNNLQSDNNFVGERYDVGGSFAGVLYGFLPGSQIMAGVNGIDLTVTVGSPNTILAVANPGTAYQATGNVTNSGVNLVGSSNRIYIATGTNGLGAVQSIRYRVLVP